MSRYIRPKVPGASVFFTVNLADRGARTLVEHVDALRKAVRVTKAERPFHIDAWVVLPDHMHAVWTLPEGDCDYSTRMAAIKAQFTAGLRRSGFRPTLLESNGHGAKGGRVRVVNERVGLKPDLRGGQGSDVRRGNEAPIWQKRFWEHHIRNDADWANHVHYCWYNPVKHGLVERPEDWPYSSYHRDR
jgi:putative transposase